ncbi:cytochrome c maturation protein CcmE [Rhizosaccharibacter radicis]|uniref:Cytochrome c-type biogenesis protein CcmE n=1 Tax=Rhizosaccharibacter radicis TaxID=2782605 RepID=A0ABT1VXP7_9PROT|nr:cytochrome c maturation protein CcmE [Acetobacteraceae bacterium KSS12]
MTRKSRRLWLVGACALGLGSATTLALAAFRQDIVFFMAPSQLLAAEPAAGRTIRLGGMVVAGSLHEEHAPDGTPIARFAVTDGQKAITVRYAGILPDLFREGQSVVALGSLAADRSFRASEVLAKHDETYMPKDVADALRRSGKWDPRFGPPPSAASWNNMTAAARPATDRPVAADAPGAPAGRS